MKSKTVLVLAISFAFILGTMLAGTEGVFAAKDDEKKTENKEKKEKKVIIIYKSDETDKKDEKIKGKKHQDKEIHVDNLKGKNVKIKYVYDIIPGIAATVDEDSIIDLMNDEDVLAVVDDAEVHTTLQGSIPQINADDVHAAGITGTGVNVCIIDTGVDDSHPALNTLIAEIDFVNDDSDATDDHYHGTHVAGIIASTDSTNKGVAPGSSLMAVKVLNFRGSGYISDVVLGIEWCVDNDADVISMSLGYGLFGGTCDSNPDAAASNNAVADGVVVIASSGNNGSTIGMVSPSCGSDVISVGAVSQNDVRASFSNGSPDLDVVAPGVSIQSLNLGGSGYRTLSGTSMSAPHVSGTAALMLESNSELTPAEIRTILRDSSVDLGSTGFDNLYGYGRINAQAAVDMANGIEPTPDTEPPVISVMPTDISTSTDIVDGTVIVTWSEPTATDNVGVTSFSSTHNSGDAFPIGTAVVTYTASDAAGNSANSSFTVTVTFIEPPPTEEFFNLSKNSDSSTDDREFETSDTIHILVFSPIVDTDNMKKAEFKIQDSKKVKLQGKLTLGADGVYSASVSLADLNPGTAKVELKLEDNNRIKFNVRENITILGTGGPPPPPSPPSEEFFKLSKNSDFSTDDREFETSDILYMLTTSNLVDYSNMKKAEFKIQDSKKVKLQGKLTLGADGIFTASVSLADLNPGTAKVELKLEDNNRIKFNVRENITIS